MSIAELDGLFNSPSDGREDRLPPQDLHAEQSVIGGMLLSKDAIADCVESLRSVDFYRPAHETIYDAILDLYGRGEPADAVTVADELTKRGDLARIGGPAYLHQLIASVPTAANAGYYAQIVAERAVLRRLVDAGTRIVQLGYAQGGGDVEDIVNQAQAEVYAVADRRGSDDYHALGEILEMTVDEIEHASGRSGEFVGVPTGITELDQLTNGLHPGQMIVVAARPAVGKALALDTPLLTTRGWSTMGGVRVGDDVYGADGRPTRVVAATETMMERSCLRLEFCDGTVLVADADHQWLVTVWSRPMVRTTREVAGLLAAGTEVTVPACQPIADTFLGSEFERRQVLGDVLGARGSVARDGSVVLAGLNAFDVELVSGLGYVVRRSRGDGVFWAAQEVFTDDLHRLRHKRAREKQPSRTAQRRVTAVTPVGSVPVRCIEVAAADHLYLAGRTLVPTHNSTLGLDIARSAAIKHKQATVVFSLEMSKTEITMRLLAAEASIQLQNMRKGTMRDEDWARLARTMGEVSDAPLFIDDSPNMSLMEIRAKCRRLKQRNNLKLVIIDYLQLMSSGKRVESRQQEVSEFSRALKLLAKELEVPVVAISQLNRGPEQRTDKKPQMSDLRESGCLTADTRVMRADTGAEVTLGDLYQGREHDVPVWSLDDSLRYVARHLVNVFPTGVKPVFRLTLASGKTVRATESHPFLCYEGWRPLGDLRTGARIAVPRHVPAPGSATTWDDRRIILLAHLLGDGSFVRHQPLRYASIDEQNLRAVTQAALAFGVTAVRDDYPAARCAALRLRAPFALTHGRRNPIVAWLDELGLYGLRSHEKFVPAEIFHVSKSQVALFLRHIWATDGSVTVTKSRQGGRIYYASTSRRLVDDLSRLLLRFGISTRTRITRKVGYRNGYTIDISGSDDQRRFLQEIGVHGDRAVSAAMLLDIVRAKTANTNVDTVPVQVWDDVKDLLTDRGMTHRQFQAAMGTQYCGSSINRSAPSRQRLGRMAALLDSADLELLAVNDVLWDAVVSIEPDGVEQVYDATVLDTHNFVANGIAVHNSIEQDSDIVILLHRESLYERESPREGEADLIVAKHRNGPTDTITVAFQGHYSRFTNMAASY